MPAWNRMAEFVIKLADERGRMQEQCRPRHRRELRARFTHAGYHVFSIKARGRHRLNAAARSSSNRSSSSTSSSSPSSAGRHAHPRLRPDAGQDPEEPPLRLPARRCYQPRQDRQMPFRCLRETAEERLSAPCTQPHFSGPANAPRSRKMPGAAASVSAHLPSLSEKLIFLAHFTLRTGCPGLWVDNLLHMQ